MLPVSVADSVAHSIGVVLLPEEVLAAGLNGSA